MSERTIGGLTLSEYAGIYAGTSEGFPLDVVLEAHGISPGAWTAIDEAWGDAVSSDLQAGGSLSDEFDLAMFEAQAQYRRAIPPLDEDLTSWFAFVRAWSGASDPVAFLQERGLGPNDLARLHRHWSERLAGDPELQKQALAALQAEGEAPVPHPEPLELRSVLQRHDADEPPAPSEREPPRAPSLKEALPSTNGTMPEPRPRPAPATPVEDEGKTWVDGALPVQQQTPAETTQVPPSSAVDAFAAVPLPAGFAPPPVETVIPSDPTLTDELTLAQYAALCAELEVSPEDAVAVFLKYGLGNEQRRARIDARWRERLETRTLLYAEWRQLYRHFKEHFLSLRKR
jgi:hypothetical protein